MFVLAAGGAASASGAQFESNEYPATIFAVEPLLEPHAQLTFWGTNISCHPENTSTESETFTEPSSSVPMEYAGQAECNSYKWGKIHIVSSPHCEMKFSLPAGLGFACKPGFSGAPLSLTFEGVYKEEYGCHTDLYPEESSASYSQGEDVVYAQGTIPFHFVSEGNLFCPWGEGEGEYTLKLMLGSWLGEWPDGEFGVFSMSS
ncbi:MAG TPA: hypothetical protein VFT19_01295 [Solirubrobacterales bacterium]|nr:hypothetical protein [Solirubrobacterales bacterium]